MKSVRLVLTLTAAAIICIRYIETFKFRNLECKVLDKNFTDFEYCHLKVVNRSFGYLSLKVNLFKVPIHNVTVKFSLNKRANGYKPFLYNVSVDACKYLKSPKTFPVVKFFHSLFDKYTNMNHTCPFDHDLIVEKLDNRALADTFINKLPIPSGNYALYTIWIAYGIPRAVVNVYMDIN